MDSRRLFLIDQTEYEVTGWSADDSYLSHVSGKFENKFQDICRLILSKEDIALDIGANIGVTSMILAHHLSDGKVFAVEPGKRLFKLMNENLSASGFTNVSTFEYAISEQSGRMSFIEHSAFGHLVEGESQNIDDPNAVETLTLDAFAERVQLSRLDFLKIDTEGFEPQVFAGAERTLERFKPIIYFELNTWTLLAHSKSDPLEFAKSVCDRFGTVYRIKKDSDGLYLEKIDGPAQEVAVKMIHDNIAFNNSCDDFVVCADQQKMARVHEVVNNAFAASGQTVKRPPPTLIQRARRKLGAMVAGKQD